MSALTRSDADAILVRRARAVMERAGLVTTATSPNIDLTDPMVQALDVIGFPPASRAQVTDGDLARVPQALQGRFIDRAEIALVTGLVLYFASKPKSQKWLNKYEVDYASIADSLREYVRLKTESLTAGPTSLSGPAVGVMPDGPSRAIDPNPYYPGRWF